MGASWGKEISETKTLPSEGHLGPVEGLTRTWAVFAP